MLYLIEPTGEADGWVSGNAVNQWHEEDRFLSFWGITSKMAVKIYKGFSLPWRNDGIKSIKNVHPTKRQERELGEWTVLQSLARQMQQRVPSSQAGRGEGPLHAALLFSNTAH